jgi:tetratricopeptide (TPR) repeat protein
MIQPLRSSKTTWFVYWLDLEEPVPSGNDFFLPTLLLVCDDTGTPISAPDVLEELDQVRVENFLVKLFEKLGPPDKLAVCNSEEWDEDAWKMFSQENNVEIRFQRFDRGGPDEIKNLAKSVVLRVSRQGGSEPRAQDVARGLVNTALRIRSAPKKLALLRAALERDSECSLARVELADADFQQGNWKNCLAGYEEIISREMPRWQEQPAVWWTDRETRPFLRSLYGRAMTLWHEGHHLDAASQFEALLAFNAKDNQGVRFFIPLLYLLSEQQDTALAWFEKYEKDYPKDYEEPSFQFGWGLTLYLDGHEAEAKARYTAAILKNIYIAPMLLELPEPPRNLWHPNDRAEPAYASEFIDSYAVLWDREVGALRLLREVWEEIQPRVQQIVAHRENMADFQDQRYEPDYKKQWKENVEIDEKLTTAPAAEKEG